MSHPLTPRSRLDDQIRYANAAASFDKTDGIRREREARERAAEEAQLEALYQAHKARELKAKWAAEEEAIVDAIETKKKEASKRALMVQKVSNESAELRALKEKLRAAEVSFERKLQMEEKEMIAEADREYDVAVDVMMERDRVKAVFAEEQAAAAARSRRAKSRLVLEEQIAEKVAMQEEAREAFLAERDAVDAVAAKIRAEDEAEARRKQQKVVDTRAFITEFLAMREDLREKERERLRAEEEKIAAFAAEIIKRQEEAEALKAGKREEADRVLAKLSADKEENDRKRDEMEELINRLYFEEQEEKHRAAMAAKAESAEAAKREMMRANEEQLAIKRRMREEEAAEEEMFRRKMFEKFAEEDRVEQMHATKRRMKMQEHKREVERLAAVKKAMYELQIERELEEQRGRESAEAAEAAMVEEERQRLLRDHAARLKDYLPKGVVASSRDLDLINTISSQMSGMDLGSTRAGTRAAGSRAFEM